MLNDHDIQVLKHSQNIMWQAMDALIAKCGYSDLTLNLEGTYYDVQDIVNKVENNKIEK